MNFLEVILLLAGITGFTAVLIITILHCLKHGEDRIRERYNVMLNNWWNANKKNLSGMFSVKYIGLLLEDLGKGLDGKECKWLE